MGKPKKETFVYDRKAQIAALFPSREDSYERLLETDQQFVTDDSPVEEQAVTSVWLEELMRDLSEEEREIIRQLYFLDKSEREACAALPLIIPKFGIIKVIPNKTGIPKFNREPLQRKDFRGKTSG